MTSFYKVEMAGFEPASERFDPRMSTSVVKCLILPVERSFTLLSTSQPFEPEGPLSRD
jgi:hypothetical protein